MQPSSVGPDPCNMQQTRIELLPRSHGRLAWLHVMLHLFLSVYHLVLFMSTYRIRFDWVKSALLVVNQPRSRGQLVSKSRCAGMLTRT